ncbi:MAG: hypothetical protein DRJ38_02950 [Thermoprotei archaeon]|nr:MAG: hypothetical protein DRJ38_02950 [Thermoprotei archaeon]
MSKVKIKARTIVEGQVEGKALISKDPISFYGGVDPETGIVREKGHSLEGVSIANKILIFPYGKGSTVGSYVILALAKNNVAPKAIINLESEPIIIIGCILTGIPLVDRPEKNIFDIVKDDDNVKVIARKDSAYILVSRDKFREKL